MLPGRLAARLHGPQLRRWAGWAAASRARSSQHCSAASSNAAADGRRSAAGGGGAAAAEQRMSGRPSVGDVLELSCTDLAFGGEGICRLEGCGFVVFVDRALPGERLTARVEQSKRSFARAAKLRTLEPHDNAAEPQCEHFGPCGGCTLQNLEYGAQLEAKQRQVADLLSRVAGVDDVAAVLLPIVGCQPGERYRYRNKVEFSLSCEPWEPQGSQQQERHAAASAESSSSSTGASSSSGGSRRGSRRAQQGGKTAAGTDADAAGGGKGFALGFHRPGSNTQVLPLRRCLLQTDAANDLLQRVQQLVRQHGLQPFDPRTGQGLLQEVTIRKGTAAPGPGSASSSSSSSASASASSSSSGGSEEYLVAFTTARDGREALAPVASALMQPWSGAPVATGAAAGSETATAEPHPPAAMAGVVNLVSQKGRPVGERRLAAEHVLAGRGFLTERLCGLGFRVSAASFFQTNTRQAEVLYKVAAAAADLRPADTLLDLYCGTGSIGLTLAAACSQLYGVEVNAAAVRDARHNAERNGIANATFLQGDLQKLRLDGRLPRPDVVVVDPARPGLSPLVVEYLRSCGARRIVYISCNAATQARDIRALCSPGGGAGSDGSSSGGGNGGGSGGNSGRAARAGAEEGSGAGAGPYQLKSVQAVDLYAQTWHVETIAVLDAVA